MISTRMQLSTRQLAGDDYAAPAPRESRGHMGSLQRAETTSTQSQAETWRLAGGAGKVGSARSERPVCEQSMSELLELRRPEGCSSARHAPGKHHCQLNGIDANDVISGSHTGACRSANLHSNIIVTETRSRRSQVARRVLAAQATATPAPEAASTRNALDPMTRSNTGS